MGKKIGSGSFGEIYQAYDMNTFKDVAIKIERLDVPKPQLQDEAKLLKLLKGMNGFP
jgi:predicted Ser/Thr protein kinase